MLDLSMYEYDIAAAALRLGVQFVLVSIAA